MPIRISSETERWITQKIAEVCAASSDPSFIEWAERWIKRTERRSGPCMMAAGRALAAKHLAKGQEQLVAAANEYAVAHAAACLLVYGGNVDREQAQVRWCERRLAGEIELPALI